MKHLMSGNEATARGVYEAGIKICSAYPGTPSTEILENLPQYKDDVYCEWAPNEKVATEVAYGASIAGSRSFCTMKMVGLNVAADPLFTAGYMGVGGAFIVVTADDPSCHASQKEQDNRHYARAAKIAMVEPSDAQECKDFVALACEVSELFDTPVLYRTTTRVCHSKGLVEFGEREEHTHAPYARNVRKFVCTPAHAYANHPIVEERLKKLEEYGCTRALENGLNKREMGDGKVGVITASVAYEYAKEVFPEGTSFLKLGLTFPLPMDLIRDFASRVEKLYVIEELEPFMEDQIKAAGIPCVGKELTGLLYELNTPDGLYRQVLFERAAQVVAVEVGVDFGGEDALVSQHLLHLTYACAPFEQVRGERVPERMRADVFVDAGALGGLLQDREDHHARKLPAPVVEEYDLFARTCAAALFEIALYLVACDGADRHQPLLVALADDTDVALPEKEVGEPQRGELRDA